MVEKTYRKKSNAKHPFEKLKSISGSSIPSCESELAPQGDRSAFVARLWGKAHHQVLNKIPTNGWENVDSEFCIIWFHGEQLPPALIPEVQVDDNSGDALEDDGLEGMGECVNGDHDLLPEEMESDEDENTDDDHE